MLILKYMYCFRVVLYIGYIFCKMWIKWFYFGLFILNFWNKRFEKYVNMVKKVRDYESNFKIS